MSGELPERESLEQALARLEALTTALERVSDANARAAAREALGLLLDLHARALERLGAIVAESAGGAALFERLAQDEDVRAILLLHGLHPQSVEHRLAEVIARMQPAWSARGLHVDLMSVGETFAIVRLQRNGRAEPGDALRREIENALTDAAPDLDDILIEMDLTAVYAETAA